ncbi:chymotrypsin-elastase inhibitor ixodidin-like [Anopheles funestus]|uniref:chymotrypsin-elastase inhibitor ixodidin-like n=1 Tax=Anopheles funestus TaxID=62324 RepID=UPI0020C6F899|nr:chymotrypsin-elastase inhibitor ixodidin-like [Anopheles funestus]
MKFVTSLLAIILTVTFLLFGETVAQDPEPEPEPIVCTDPNEIYDDCGPICGDRTCANQRKNDVVCRRACMEGCFCKGGYVRNKSRKCIPSYMCASMG